MRFFSSSPFFLFADGILLPVFFPLSFSAIKAFCSFYNSPVPPWLVLGNAICCPLPFFDGSRCRLKIYFFSPICRVFDRFPPFFLTLAFVAILPRGWRTPAKILFKTRPGCSPSFKMPGWGTPWGNLCTFGKFA